MKKHATCALAALCWLSMASACSSFHAPEGGLSSGEEKETAPAAASERPVRGFGQDSQDLAVGRGRAQYRPVQLTSAEIDNLGITTVKASYQSVHALHPAMGRVLAPQFRMAKVSYAFPARIAAVHARIGDWVDRGQPVLTVQSEEVGHAKTEFYRAIADLELAKKNYEREKRLVDYGVGAMKNALTTEAELKVAQVNLDAAEKKLHVLGFSEEEVSAIAVTHQINPEITLFAPIHGRVIEHNAVLGGMIDQSADLMTIMDPTLLWVDADIFERDIAKIRIGQEVQIKALAYPSEAFRGKISYIGETMNQETRTINVRTEVQNPDLKLKHGMFADITILLNGGQKVLTVPMEAILDDRDEKIVFVKTDGLFMPRLVQLGSQQNGYCGIAEGLEEGEEVVAKGAYMLKSKLYDAMLRKAHIH